MSQSSRPKKQNPVPAPAAKTNSVGAIISALVVVGIFAVLGYVLFASSGNNTVGTASSGAVDPATTAAASTAATSETAGQPAVVAGDVAARNDKYAQQGPPPLTIDPAKTYTATITTPRGDIDVKLRPDLAPETVNNFVFLAREGFYDGVTWHRVLENFMAQTGDPTGTGGGGPGYTIKDEFSSNISFDKPGLLAMAKTSAPNSAGSQFFITTAPATWLDGQYTIFGEVTKGQDIVNAIPLRDPDQSPTTPGEQIVKVTVNEQ